jgi:pyridoxamine 5'-phosphate oxidase
MDLKSVREDYTKKKLTIEDLNSNPIEQLRLWFKNAIDEIPLTPNAMTLSTLSSDGHPRSRVVLLKEIKDEGITFFTNYDSRKGKEISFNSKVSVTIFWKEMERQINIIGDIEKLSLEESKNYFYSRPRESQLSAIVSPQSEKIGHKSELESKINELKYKYGDNEFPYPDNWGGYLIKPLEIEFWQGRPNRLHDRFHYRKNKTHWDISTLAP